MVLPTQYRKKPLSLCCLRGAGVGSGCYARERTQEEVTNQTQALAQSTKKELSLAEVDGAYLKQLYLMFRDPTLPDDAPKQPTRHELTIFAQYCAANGLDPLGKDIYFIKDKKGKVHYQISIDGLRSRSESSGEYLGRLGPLWVDKAGVWHDHWILEEAPMGCKVGILRKGYAEPTWGFARFQSYCQSRESWSNWGKMPEVMIAKCAEAQAHRAAFPKNCAKLYVAEEMMEVVEGTIIEDLPSKPLNTKAFGSPVINPAEAKAVSVSPEPQPQTPEPTEERSPDAATDEEFEQIKRATNLFGGQVIEKVRKAVEQAQEEEFAPEDDGDLATAQEIEEVWAPFMAKYGRGDECREKMISLGVSSLKKGQATKRSCRLIREHLNHLLAMDVAF